MAGYIFSAILHIGLIVFMFFGLPSLFQKKPPLQTAITVEILPVSSLTNVKPNRQKIAKKDSKQNEKKPVEKKAKPVKPKKMEKPAPKKVEKPEPVKPKPKEPAPVKKKEPVKKIEPKKPPVKEKPKPKVEPKKVEPKKVEPKKELPKKKPLLNDKKPIEKKMSFDDIAGLVDSLDIDDKAKKEDDKKQSESKESSSKTLSNSNNYNPTKPLSISEEGEIRRQIEQNWIPPVGSRGLSNMVVNLQITLLENGMVTGVKILNSASQLSDPVFRALAESGERAVLKASPIKNLPTNKYNTWKEIKLNFDASQIF